MYFWLQAFYDEEHEILDKLLVLVRQVKTFV
jgi:hypothetical protein